MSHGWTLKRINVWKFLRNYRVATIFYTGNSALLAFPVSVAGHFPRLEYSLARMY